MKALHLSQNTISTASKKAFQLYDGLAKFPALNVNKAQKYISEALSEGLKQNLLGTEINMEFLILSIRSYSGLLYNMLSYRSNTKTN